MGKNNRVLPLEHLKAEYRAMRWLYKIGLSCKEIQVFSWRDVDEFDKKVRLKRELFFAKYDPKTDILVSDTREKQLLIDIDDREVMEFFAHSRIYCHWCFIEKKPLSWRKDKSIDSLFPLCKIEEICSDESKNSWISALTIESEFGTIKVSKENIEKTKTKEQAKEAALVN